LISISIFLFKCYTIRKLHLYIIINRMTNTKFCRYQNIILVLIFKYLSFSIYSYNAFLIKLSLKLLKNSFQIDIFLIIYKHLKLNYQHLLCLNFMNLFKLKLILVNQNSLIIKYNLINLPTFVDDLQDHV